jgi:hypothetical protein
MIKDIGGKSENIQGLICHLPKEGYVYNPYTGDYQEVGVERRAIKYDNCYWEIDKRWEKFLIWEKEEAEKQKQDPRYIHPDLKEFKEYCWIRRIGGHWFMNNNKPTYITGTHWFYLSCYHLDIGLPKYRKVDRDFFYAWQYTVEDDNAFGLCETTKRRSGKTYRAGAIALEQTTRSENFWTGIQSKTDDDAKSVFRKAIVNPFRKLPSFFKPVSDMPNTGKVPATGLKFQSGKVDIDGEELMSGIDFKSSTEGAYDGQKLGFYIADEAGKTTLVDINRRWNVVKYCLMDDEGRIIGKSLHTTTVEEMEAGGKPYLQMWKGSDQNTKEGRRTQSGMYKFFTPADETRHIDKFGNANKELARIDILEERKALQNDPRALSSAKRKEPLDEKEAFQTDASTCVFNPILLNDRLDILKWTKKKIVTGNLQWDDMKRDGTVTFHENPNGKFQIIEFPDQVNNVTRKGDIAFAQNKHMYCGGIDPYDHVNVSKGHESRMSNGALCIMKKSNPLRQTDADNAPVLLYVARPSPEVFYEDCLMALHYYGCQALIENNKPGILHYFEKRGYTDFCFKVPGKDKPGIAATLSNNIYIAELTDQYINDNVDNIWYEQILEDWLGFSPDDTTEYDVAMAVGYALMMMYNPQFNPKRKEVKTERIEDYFSFYKSKGTNRLFGKYL